MRFIHKTAAEHKALCAALKLQDIIKCMALCHLVISSNEVRLLRERCLSMMLCSRSDVPSPSPRPPKSTCRAALMINSSLRLKRLHCVSRAFPDTS